MKETINVIGVGIIIACATLVASSVPLILALSWIGTHR